MEKLAKAVSYVQNVSILGATSGELHPGLCAALPPPALKFLIVSSICNAAI